MVFFNLIRLMLSNNLSLKKLGRSTALRSYATNFFNDNIEKIRQDHKEFIEKIRQVHNQNLYMLKDRNGDSSSYISDEV